MFMCLCCGPPSHFDARPLRGACGVGKFHKSWPVNKYPSINLKLCLSHGPVGFTVFIITEAISPTVSLHLHHNLGVCIFHLTSLAGLLEG